jgi:hypothetical protein
MESRGRSGGGSVGVEPQKGAVEGGELQDPDTYPHQRDKMDPNLDGSATLSIGIQTHLGVRGKDLYNN